ncbi:hypothetical protein B296_00023211 [Ensete ventricosum]|uniref:Uncharacterized protein n=1 Tax=Ensete ventricosum TaxID=4639 RepID=A0A426YVS8_ENSVE|nr:hypothetical protein B296_00023211 [Ensete ventricosum]
MWQQRVRHVEVYELSPCTESKSEGFVDLTLFSNREAGTATGLPTRPSSAGEVTTRWTAEGRREVMRTRRADADGYGGRCFLVLLRLVWCSSVDRRLGFRRVGPVGSNKKERRFD